jgi:NADPH2:quinone reductase
VRAMRVTRFGGPEGPQLAELPEPGDLRPVPGATYALSEARSAHEHMRGPRSTGKVVLDPSA